MNITNFRFSLSAIASYDSRLPGQLGPRRMGFEQSVDFPPGNVAHIVRLEVTNFGTGGNTITINAATLAATLGTGAAASVTDGEGLDVDGFTLEPAHYFLLAFKVSGGSDGVAVRLSGDNFNLIAESGLTAVGGVLSSGLIPASGTWTITGPTGAQSPAFVIEILVFGTD